jgi:hypothetical protein
VQQQAIATASGRLGPGDGRLLGFQIRPSAKQVMRQALKHETASCDYLSAPHREGRSNGYAFAHDVNSLERAALVKLVSRPGMTDDEVEEIARIVDAYLSGRLCAADWRLWVCRRACDMS